MKPKIGQELVIYKIRKDIIYKGKVTKVGKKYYHVELASEGKWSRTIQFSIYNDESHEPNYFSSAEYRAYASQEEYENDIRKRALAENLNKYLFCERKWIETFSLEQLEQIAEIVTAKEKNKQ
jgi:hypothetical protein